LGHGNAKIVDLDVQKHIKHILQSVAASTTIPYMFVTLLPLCGDMSFEGMNDLAEECMIIRIMQRNFLRGYDIYRPHCCACCRQGLVGGKNITQSLPGGEGDLHPSHWVYVAAEHRGRALSLIACALMVYWRLTRRAAMI
jgi:hypothetical protein